MDQSLPELAAVLQADEPAPADVLDALGALATLRADLDRMEHQLIGVARERGISWREVAAALGLGSRQAAEQRWLRLGAAATRDPAAERHRRQRQRNFDTSTGEPVAALREQITILHDRLARRRDWAEHSPAAGLALQTLAAALDAPPGGLYDLARLAAADLRTIPQSVLGRATAEAVERVTALLQPGTEVTS